MLSRFSQISVTVFLAHVRRWWRTHLLFLATGLIFSVGFYWLLAAPLPNFPKDSLVQIEYGTSLPQIARVLGEKRLIRSEIVFIGLVRLFGGAESIDAGTYRFDEPVSVATIAARLIRGEYGVPEIRLTLPEGLSAREMSLLVAPLYTDAFAKEFLREAKPYEGFLFPDTYHFSGGDTPATIVAHMREVFDKRTAELRPLVSASGRSLGDTVRMASLLEREANTPEDQRVVAGILWKRLDIGMPLQVDAVFAYIFEKTGYAPTLDDLKVESPFNTYLNRGLPPTPIGNPGLEALTAALTPTPSPYLYYITGNDGAMYYAKTFAEHERNIEKYLK
jgi:UPF0755 protein